MRKADQVVNMLLEEARVIAVDLDGTLARHLPHKFDKDKIGEPVPEMLEKVKAALKSGKTVKIFTARASEPENVPAIKKWLKDHDLPELEITNEKTKDMDEFWDDKARGVVKNHGVFKD